jgi:TonB-linked SusC/RagA family outer membrane protein
MIRKTCRWLAVAAVSLLGSLGAPQLAAQAGGTITGRVTESAGEPLGGVQVNVVGTSVRTSTDASGQFTLRGVPAGRSVTVQAQRVGYAEQARTVTVPSGGTATVSFQLQTAAVQLAAIVATATGERRRVEVGNAVTQVNAATIVEERPVANMTDLLTARAPGVQVLPGGMTGTGARVRVRGTSSLSLSNDPIYIIDGVRMQSSRESSSISTGGQLPSRLGDINPEEIESMEVVKGPSAATLYGTDAANGVIVIRTKRGRAGRPQWSLYTEQGILEDRNEYPAAYRAYTRSTGFTPTTPSGGSQCFLADRARAACTQDSVTSYNLFDNPRATPYARGSRQQYGIQVSGGTESMRYFVSGEREQETGVLRMPAFEQARLRAQGLALREEWVRPNALERLSGRANLNLTFSPKADVAISTAFTHQNLRLPQHENNAVGLGSNAYGGPGSAANTNAAGDSLFGYRAYAPGDIFQLSTTQGIDRFIGSITGNYRPLEWLSARGNAGLDFTSRVDEEICRRGECPNFSTYRQGFKRDNRTSLYTGSLDGSASAEFQPLSWLQTRTTVGAQFYQDVFDRNGSYGENLPPGGTQITSAATLFASETTAESRTFGAFIEENLTFGDRLFITAGVRSDRNSAFGADFKTVYYPKLAASYVISEERWFPNFGGTLDELRFRAAWGASGVQPGTIDAVQYLGATQVRVDAAELPGVVFTSLGNRNLRPERSEELELGVDGTFLNNRVNAEFTYYNKRSEDALIDRVLPPSLGTGSTSRFENLGAVRNWGYEALVNAQLVQRRAFGWDVTLNGSTNSNELEDLGDVPPIIGATIRQIEGYPVNGWWQRPIVSFEDKNSDGILGVEEVVVGDTAVFMGYSIPRHEVAFTNGFDFANRTIRLVAMFDYKGGSKQLYGTERIRCQNRGNCRGALDPTAPLEEQAAAIALRTAALGNTQAGYIVDNSFIRFRELALNVAAPEGWARRVGSRSMSVTVSARNLKLWSDYPGVDPETGYGSDVISDFQSQPPPTYITLRLNLGL